MKDRNIILHADQILYFFDTVPVGQCQIKPIQEWQYHYCTEYEASRQCKDAQILDFFSRFSTHDSDSFLYGRVLRHAPFARRHLMQTAASAFYSCEVQYASISAASSSLVLSPPRYFCMDAPSTLQ